MTGLRPKKRFGQHFLFDRNLLAKIVRTAGVSEGDLVLEAGPGLGTLTEALLDAGAIVAAIEIDRDACAFLREKFSGVERLELIEGDVLEVSYLGLSRDRKTRFRLVSNPPYNITGPLLFKIFEERRAFSTVVLMLQKEVCQRLVSPPGTKDYGVLSVLFQTYFDVSLEFNVSRDLFRPRPRVDSGVVSMSPLSSPRVFVEDEGFFVKVVKSAFSHRRKTLFNSLKFAFPDARKLREAIEEAGIDPGIRAEDLGLAEFSGLAKVLKRLQPTEK